MERKGYNFVTKYHHYHYFKINVLPVYYYSNFKAEYYNEFNILFNNSYNRKQY